MMTACIYIQRIYIRVKREILRLQAISKTAVLSVFTDAVSGLPSLRAAGLQGLFVSPQALALDSTNLNTVAEEAVSGWYNQRVALCANFLLIVPSFALIIFYYSNLKISEVVVALFIGSGMSDEIDVML